MISLYHSSECLGRNLRKKPRLPWCVLVFILKCQSKPSVQELICSFLRQTQTFCLSLSVHWARSKETKLFFSFSSSVCKWPLSLPFFVLSASPHGYIFMYACHQELSQCRYLQGRPLSVYLTDYVCVQVCVRAYVNRYVCDHACMCESSCIECALVPMRVYPFDSLPRGLQGAALISKPPFPGQCKCVKKGDGRVYVLLFILLPMSWYFTGLLGYIFILQIILLCHLAVVILLGLERKERRWNWAEICQTWWCLPTLLPHRSV